MNVPTVCRYCGGVVRLIPAEQVFRDATERLGQTGEKLYQCQNCNARVGCHRGTMRPLGKLPNETLRLKRMEAHRVFDAWWKSQGMSRTKAYKWLAQRMEISTKEAHIGGFEMEQCQQLLDLCGRYEAEEAA